MGAGEGLTSEPQFLRVEEVLVLISEFQLCSPIKNHSVLVYNYCMQRG